MLFSSITMWVSANCEIMNIQWDEMMFSSSPGHRVTVPMCTYPNPAFVPALLYIYKRKNNSKNPTKLCEVTLFLKDSLSAKYY